MHIFNTQRWLEDCGGGGGAAGAVLGLECGMFNSL